MDRLWRLSTMTNSSKCININDKSKQFWTKLAIFLKCEEYIRMMCHANRK